MSDTPRVDAIATGRSLNPATDFTKLAVTYSDLLQLARELERALSDSIQRPDDMPDEVWESLECMAEKGPNGWRFHFDEEGTLINMEAAHAKAEAATAYAGECAAALQGMLDRYVGLVNSGDAGNWNPETMNSGPRPDSSLTDSASASHQQAPLGVGNADAAGKALAAERDDRAILGLNEGEKR